MQTNTLVPSAAASFKESPLLDSIVNFAFTGNNEFIFRIYEELMFKISPEQIANQLAEIHRRDPNFALRYQQLQNDPSLAKDFDLQSLIKLPANTFGYKFAKHMLDNNLDNNFAARFDFQNEWSFYIFTIMQTHDAWHILTGCNTDYLGEIGLTGFYLGQHANAPTLATVIADFLNAMLDDDLYKLDQAMLAFSNGYHIGRAAAPILGLDWEAAFQEDLDALRQRLKIDPAIIAPQPEVTF